MHLAFFVYKYSLWLGFVQSFYIIDFSFASLLGLERLALPFTSYDAHSANKSGIPRESELWKLELFILSLSTRVKKGSTDQLHLLTRTNQSMAISESCFFFLEKEGRKEKLGTVEQLNPLILVLGRLNQEGLGEFKDGLV